MVVVEDAVRLPRLPEVPLERDAGVVDDAVVVDVRQGDAVRCYKQLNNITSCHIK